MDRETLNACRRAKRVLRETDDDLQRVESEIARAGKMGGAEIAKLRAARNAYAQKAARYESIVRQVREWSGTLTDVQAEIISARCIDALPWSKVAEKIYRDQSGCQKIFRKIICQLKK